VNRGRSDDAPGGATPPGVGCHAEPYRPGRLVDVFRPPGAAGAPVVLFWHGSGPDERDILAPLAAGIARLGPLVLVPDWRSDDDVAGPEDLLASIDFARSAAAGLGGDPGRMVLAGWSLGANAAAAVAGRPGIADGWNPAGLVGLAGSYDGSPFDGRGGAGERVGGAGRPALLAHGTDDPIVPVERSVGAAAELDGAGWRVVLRRVGTDHAGIIGTEYNPWRRRCVPTDDPGRLAVLDEMARAVADLAHRPDRAGATGHGRAGSPARE
jgi:predicted esterase